MITPSTPIGTAVYHTPYGQGFTTSQLNQDGDVSVQFTDANGRPRHLNMWAYELTIGVILAKPYCGCDRSH